MAMQMKSRVITGGISTITITIFSLEEQTLEKLARKVN